MTPPQTLLAMIACILVPMIIVLAVLRVWSGRRDRLSERAPVSEKLLRSPGESLRLKIDELNEKVGDAMALAIVVSAAPLAILVLAIPGGYASPGFALLAFAMYALLLYLTLRRAFKLITKRRDYRQGFHAERAVGEELNQLMRDGCRVFHDVPMEPYGNIDHVIVSPAGVFAVETKSRQKRPAPNGKLNYKATFDGVGMDFPTWREVDMVSQAKMQGDRLRAFLTSAVGEPVDVLAILTLPGWWLESSVPPGAVRVLNPKMIKSLATDSRSAKLSPEMMQRIAHPLEQKCRDVEL